MNYRITRKRLVIVLVIVFFVGALAEDLIQVGGTSLFFFVNYLNGRNTSTGILGPMSLMDSSTVTFDENVDLGSATPGTFDISNVTSGSPSFSEIRPIEPTPPDPTEDAQLDPNNLTTPGAIPGDIPIIESPNPFLHPIIANRLEKSYQNWADRPDLVLPWVGSRYENSYTTAHWRPDGQGNYIAYIDLEVDNWGKNMAPGFYINLRSENDKVQVGNNSGPNINLDYTWTRLKSHEKLYVRRTLFWKEGTPPPNTRIVITVDPTKIVPERDEYNNQAIINVIGDESSLQADLTFGESVAASWVKSSAGDYYYTYFFVTVYNLGERAVNGFQVKFESNNDLASFNVAGVERAVQLSYDGVSLAPDEKKKISYRIFWRSNQPPPNSVKVKATVDPENKIGESHEGNNQVELALP